MDPDKPRKNTNDADGDKFFTPPLIIIFATVFIDLIGFGMVIPILPFYAHTEPFNASPFEIGLLLASYSAMQFVFSPILGRLSDKYGRRPILFFSLLGSAFGYFVIGFAQTIALVFVGRIIGGVTGGNISTAQAYIADVTSRENRAKGMGLFGAAFGLGFILGPAIAGMLSKYGIHIPFYFAAFLSLVNSIALFFILPESLSPDARAHLPERANRFIELYGSLRDKAFRRVNFVYILLVTAFSIMSYAFVLYTAHRFNYTPEHNGYLFAFIGVIAIFGQGYLFGRLANRFGEASLVTAGCLLMALSLLAVPIVGPLSGGLGALLVGIAVLAIGNTLASPGLTSLASKSASDEEQGRALGILQSGASLARAIGPVIGGILLNNAADAIDDSTIYRTFWTASAIMFIAFFMSLYSAGTFTENRLRSEG